MAKWHCRWIREEDKLQKTYCASLFMIHMDALTLLSTDFFSVLGNYLQLWMLADIFGISLLKKTKFGLIHHLLSDSLIDTSQSYTLNDSRKYPAFLEKSVSYILSFCLSHSIFYFISISPTRGWGWMVVFWGVFVCFVSFLFFSLVGGGWN